MIKPAIFCNKCGCFIRQVSPEDKDKCKKCNNLDDKHYCKECQALIDPPKVYSIKTLLNKEIEDGSSIEIKHTKPNNPMGEVTPRDREVAATVVQWLGSPVGQSFLRNVLEDK